MWIRKKIFPIWDSSYKNFSYKRQPLTHNEEIEWRSLGYTNKYFTGMMYDSTNIIPDWCKNVSQQLGLENCGYVFYKMSTGIIMPTHVDHFSKYCKIFNKNRDEVYRSIVFLENWKPGHYFEIDNQAIVEYEAGEAIIWSSDVSHAASNIGIEDRYTLQITGTLSYPFCG